MTRVVVAWLVHLYTGLGLVCAAGIAVLIVDGSDASFRAAFMVMAVATVIDATDGFLAREAAAKHVLPFFDGALLDNIIDFQTYTSLPLLLLWRAELLPGALAWILLLPLLASAYGFSRTDAKADGFFLGFPSYWNVVAFYLYFLHAPVWVSVTLILTCTVLTFVPTRYLYPTRGGPWARTMLTGAAIWTVVVLTILTGMGDETLLAWASLVYPVAYLLLSWRVSLAKAPANRL